MTINASSHEKQTPPEKLLIIGCGDIGQRLAQQLDSTLYQVTGLRRHPPANLPYLKYQACDATQPGQLDTLFSREHYDVIVITMTPNDRSDLGYEHAYVHTCQHLVAALSQHQRRPRMIVFVSSTAVYAQNDGSWIDEQSPTQPDSFSGKRLLEAEQIIQESEFAHCIVRFSGIYGPGRNRLIEQVKQRRASASPHYTNRIHADDCAGVLAHLIEQQQSPAGLYLASDSSPTPMLEVVSWIAEQLGIENFLAADAVNERGNKRISNQLLIATGYQFRYPEFRAGYLELIKQPD